MESEPCPSSASTPSAPPPPCATGAHLGIPRAIPLLTAGSGSGRVLGPLADAPLLTTGFLLAGGFLVLAGAIGAAFLCFRFPHHDQPSLTASRTARRTT